MKWIEVMGDSLPKEKEYVLIFSDGFIGISRLIDDEWDTGDFRRRPMFKDKERIMSKLDAQYWMPLPNQPERLNPKDAENSVFDSLNSMET